MLAMVFFIRKLCYFTENYLYLATMNDYLAGVFAALQSPSIIINSYLQVGNLECVLCNLHA